MTGLTSLELWRLSDTLSVIDAAILIAGGDPNEHSFDEDGVRVQLTWQHNGFDASFRALRNAIRNNKLAANVQFALRKSQIGYSPMDGSAYEVTSLPGEQRVTYDMLVARIEPTYGKATKTAGETKLNFSVDDLRGELNLYLWKEPCWEQTTIDVDNLKRWLEGRDVFPSFFFPRGKRQEYTNKDNPRFSAKLACAMAAWEAIKNPAPGKSVKQTIQDWVQSNGVRFGLGENGVVSPTAAEEIAKIVNWNTKGGANPTLPQVAESNDDNAEIENYGFGYGPYEADSDLDSDIPF